MPAITIRKLSDGTHRELKRRAKQNGRSAEAEGRAILDEALRPDKHVGLGTAIQELVVQYGGFDMEIEREQSPARYVDFNDPEFNRRDETV